MTEGTEQATPEQAAPTGTARRIGSLDFIRGLAVMGILAANIVAFGQPFGAYMWPEAFLTPHGDAADWMWVAQFVLVDGKMRGLFTLLFGAGLYLFMEKAWQRGASRWLQVRRLAWLLVFGAIHFFLIWRGDILMFYAIAGFVAVLCLRWKAKTQFVVGLFGYLVGALFLMASIGLGYFVTETSFGEREGMAEVREGFDAGKAAAVVDDAAEAEILTDGSYAEFVAHNLSEHASDPLAGFFLFGFETLPLMLMGMALYRWGLFSGGFRANRQRWWGWIGVVVGSALTVPIALWARDTGFTYWGNTSAFMAFSHLPRLPVVLGLAALLALWGSHANGWLASRVSAAGRAAFTNYLGTSVVMMLVFHPWAGGLWGDLTRPALYVIVVVAWVLMLAWSQPWLERFRFGPLEWLWRCLTYWRLFPLRR